MGSISVQEPSIVASLPRAATHRRTSKRSGAFLVAGGALFALLLLVLAQPAFANSEIFPKTKLNADGAWPEIYYAEVSGDRVVWDGIDDVFNDDFDIYTWTPAGGAVNVSSANSLSDHYPHVSGDRIVWQGETNGGGELFTWTPADGTVQITHSEAADEEAKVSGDRIAWVYGSGYVMTWTPAGGIVEVYEAFGPANWPQVSGDRIVWYNRFGSDGGEDNEIFTWTPAGGVVQLTANTVDDTDPVVGGDRVAWNSGGTLKSWTPSGGTVTLSGMPTVVSEITTDRIVSPSGGTVVVWTPSTGMVVLPATGTANGMGVHRVAWMGVGDNVYTWTPALGTVCVTPGTYETEQYPGVSGDRLVWIAGSAVYTATPVAVADPSITSVSPSSGPIVGGNSVVIHGTNFIQLLGASAVTFGGVNATSYVVDSATQITAVAPEHAAGSVRVQVTAAGGVTPDTANDNYTYIGRPSITSVSPTSGSAAGGNSVGITGKDFIGLSGASAVTFAGVNANSYIVDSATHITAVAPALVPGVAQVKVTTASGESTNTVSYTYVPTGLSPEQFTATRLTTNTYIDDLPSVSGDRVAWAAAAGGSDTEIFTWTPSGGTVQLTNNSYDDDYPVVSGDRVAWCGKGGNDGGSDYEIFTWKDGEGKAQVTQNSMSDEAPQIAGDEIVWMAGGAEHDIYTWTPATGVVWFLSASGDDVLPTISPSGNRIAWVNLDMGNNGTAYEWTEAGGMKTVFRGTRDVVYAVAADDRVAVHGGMNDIYMWTEAGGAWVTTGELGYSLAISGDRVVWDALGANDIMQVFSWTPSEGVVQLSASTSAADLPQISGDRVVWQDEGASGVDSEVFSWTPTAGAYQVTSNSTDDFTPAVSGSRLAWVNLTSSTNTEIYTAIAGPALPQFENTDPHIVYTPTANWANYSSTSASGSSYARANLKDSSATVYFNGTRLDWIAMKGTTTGKADVYLDDVFKTTVDLAASAATYKVNVWSTGAIAAGIHKFSIVWNAGNASGKYITLDRVDVQGSLVYPAPTITSLSPSSGGLAGGTSVAINGTGFADVSSVTFGGTSVTFTVVSPTKITATAPAHAAGSVPVQVTTATGSASSDFTYSVAPPTTRVDVPAITTGGLTLSGTWAAYSSASAYGASYLRSSTAGASVVITFKGTRLDWITMKGTTGAKADIYVDGSATPAVTALDLYASPAVYQQNLWSTGTLADGYHTVKIVRNSGSASGRYLTLDAVEIAGTLQAPVRLEETASAFTFSPAWTVGSTSSASASAYRYTNTKDASVSFSFTGVGFKIIAKTASSYGNITVTIDSHSQIVSLYSSATTYKKVVLTAFLTPGAHTVTITRAGTKSSSSSGYTIDLDAIDLFGVAG